MEQSEVEVLVGELETRMERLRTLYDMYFMGIERIEPLVPKKDVERRMLQLRKEQIRNTGLRFKFQTVIQRFNTYQTYWLRISRQIEQGTYARDVRRAAARFGVDPTKERATQAEASPEATEEVEVKAFELPEELVPESGDSSLLLPLEVEDDPFAQIAVYPAPAPAPPAPRERFASASRFELDDMADPFEESDPFPRPSAPGGGKLRIAPRPGASKAPSPQENRDTERRMPVATTSFSPTPPIDPADMGPGTVPGVGARANEPRVIIARRASIPDEMERAPATRPFAPASSPSGPTIQKTGTLPTAITPPGRVAPAAPAPQPPAAAPIAAAPAAPPAVDPAARRPGTLPSAGVAFTRSIPVGPPVTPGPASMRAAAPLPSSSTQRAAPPVKPPVPPTSAPRAPAVVPAAPASKPAVSRPPAALPASPAASPAAAASPRVALPPASAPRAAPARAAPTPAPVAAPPASRIGDLSGDRFGEIFSKYVETRQKQNEPTHAITRDALAKQLSESTQRLKQKHSGKAIDFEVVVKDGKTILRPVVK